MHYQPYYHYYYYYYFPHFYPAPVDDSMTASTADESLSQSSSSQDDALEAGSSNNDEAIADKSNTKKVASVTSSSSSNSVSWDDMYLRLVAYKEEHGDCLVTRSYKADPALGKWVGSLRMQQHSMAADKRELLHDIGFCWKVREARTGPPWQEMYEQLKQYKRKHGHLKFSRTNCRPQDKQLLFWVENQRRRLAKADPSCPRRRKFEEIGALKTSTTMSSKSSATSQHQISPESTVVPEPPSAHLPPLQLSSKQPNVAKQPKERLPATSVPDMDLWRLQYGIPKPRPDHLYVPTLFVNMYAGANVIHKHLRRVHDDFAAESY